MNLRPANRWLENISTPEKTFRHPLNNSTAKQLFSFARAQRFQSSKPAPEGAHDYYDPEALLKRHTRACSLGRGSKYDFLREAKKKATPDFYSVIGSLTRNNSPKYVFGVSREMSPHFSIFAQKTNETPGPGAYNPKEVPSQTKCTFKIRLKAPKTFRNSVGPGAYETYDLFGQKSAHLPSQYNNGPQYKIALDTRKSNVRDARTPLFYDMKFQLNSSGTYYNTKYKNSLGRTFSKQRRMSVGMGPGSPGPGNYLPLSDFGVYVSSAFAKEGNSPKKSSKGN